MRLKKGGNGLAPAKDYIEASASSVTPVRTPDCRNSGRVAGCGQPVMNGRPDTSPFQRRLPFPFVARDQEQDAVARGDRSIQCAVDGFPGPVQAMAVKIDDPVGLDTAGAKPLVPAAVESGMLVGHDRPGDRDDRANRRHSSLG